MKGRSPPFPLASVWAAALAGCTLAALSAAARAATPHPDFTGIWSTYVVSGRAPPGGGGRRSTAPLPFTPEGKQRNDEYKQLLGPEKANPGAYCVDYGMPMMMEMAGGYPLEFIQKGDQLTIIFEVEGETRRVFLGKRGIPEEKRIPSRQGYSVGHWEGQTLVVQTGDLLDGEDQSHPHSDQAHITERFGLGTDAKGVRFLSYSMRMTDPVYYTTAVTVDKKFALVPDGFLFTYRCPDEFWLNLLKARRDQLHAGKPVDAMMSDVYKAWEETQK
ncbi:MAG TPA: hypothetical protein VIY90_22520 [Steroidobacteraceae bacterium]